MEAATVTSGAGSSGNSNRPKHAPESPIRSETDGSVIAGGYNNEPQQIGAAASDDGVRFTRLFQEPFLPNGPPGSWNSSESGHPYLFQDDDGQDYLFYQGNNDKGRPW